MLYAAYQAQSDLMAPFRIARRRYDAARLVDVEQRDRVRRAVARRERPVPGLALGGRVEDLQRVRGTYIHGCTLTVTGAEPISPAAQPPKTMLNSPASPPA